VSQYRFDAVVAAVECDELDLALDRDPESSELSSSRRSVSDCGSINP
jgi:hypothetical protein